MFENASDTSVPPAKSYPVDLTTSKISGGDNSIKIENWSIE